jgi:hypothetical protein
MIHRPAISVIQVALRQDDPLLSTKLLNALLAER